MSRITQVEVFPVAVPFAQTIPGISIHVHCSSGATSGSTGGAAAAASSAGSGSGVGGPGSPFGYAAS